MHLKKFLINNMNTLFVLFSLIFLIIMIPVAIYWFSFAPWLPTKRKDLARVVRCADLKCGDRFYELGCGDGRVMSYVHDNTQAQVTGIEKILPLYLVSLLRGKGRTKENRYEVRQCDLFEADISKANVIFTFGMPDKVMSRVADKIKGECVSGTRLISYVFSVPGMVAIRVDKPTEKDVPIYVYEF